MARFYEYVELWTDGQLSLSVGEFLLSMKARVARSQGDDTGMSFIIANDNDRLSIQILLDYATGQTQRIAPGTSLPPLRK